MKLRSADIDAITSVAPEPRLRQHERPFSIDLDVVEADDARAARVIAALADVLSGRVG